MIGAIRTWDVLAHPIVTIRCFGWRVFFRAVFPWHGKTFLSLLREANFFDAATTNVPAWVKRCVELELRAKRIYAALAKAFDETESASRFFADLAEQEQEHADLLELCRAAARRGSWKASYFNPWQDYVPRLEQQMAETEAAVYEIGSLDEALRLVVQIESSEINHVFGAILAATHSAFVKKLKPFREAIELHISQIVARLPELAPELLPVSRELRAKFPRAGKTPQ